MKRTTERLGAKDITNATEKIKKKKIFPGRSNEKKAATGGIKGGARADHEKTM